MYQASEHITLQRNQASEHITLQRMPPTPADAHAADPSLAHVAADSRRLLSPTPKSQTMF